MAEWLQALVLGLVQGVTEFIPVSSSGHLVLVRQLLGWPDQGLAFDAVLHLATLTAVVIYFWREWRSMAIAVTTQKQTYEVRQARKLVGLIAVTTVPAIGVGLIAADWVGATVRHVPQIAALMLVTAVFMWIVEVIARPRREIAKLNFWDSLSIGLAQAVAILPGISRSGATILTGMYHGLSREAAARYSFLAAGPVVALAGGYSLWQLSYDLSGTNDWLRFLIGFGASLVSGLLVIHWLLKFLNRHRLNIFAWYLILAGSGLLIFDWLK